MSETMCYVGVDACGCAVAVTVDGYPGTGGDVAEFIRDGLIVERKSLEWVNQNLGHRDGCPGKPMRQESLL